MANDPSSLQDVSDDRNNKKKKLFYTTSDMIKTMNKSFSSLDAPGDTIRGPRVELQRRMPDGSTRRVTEKDMEAADMDSKLKQAAEQVAHLNPQQKIEWAQRQRQEGNVLYQDGDYRAALDVYLTCLVAKTDHPSFTEQVFLPVMNNLAQCSLQLGMYRKAHRFCTMALEDEALVDEQSSNNAQLVSKLYFRRGRALRLSGEYDAARNDLNKASIMLEKDSSESRSVQRELQLIRRAEIEERRNEKKQERAMQQLLSVEFDETAAETNGMGNLSRFSQEDNRREYSTLSARRIGDIDAQQVDAKQTCWRWYLSMIGRAAEKLLVLLCDEDYSNCHSDQRNTDLSRQKSD